MTTTTARHRADYQPRTRHLIILIGTLAAGAVAASVALTFLAIATGVSA